MAPSSDVHRNLLQLLLDRGVYPEDQLLDALRDCIEAHPSEAKRAKLKLRGEPERDAKLLGAAIDAINSQLQPLKLMIAKSKFRHDKKTYYGLVNLDEDELAKAAQPLSKLQQEFFHAIVNAILGASGKRLDKDAAGALGRGLSAKMADREVRDCLKRLEEGHWLLETAEGDYLLGVRTVMQRGYLTDEAGAQGSGSAGGSAANVVDVDDGGGPQFVD